MDENDPRRPLLGTVRSSRLRRTASKLCSVQSWKRRLPITIWLPKYNFEYLLRDAIAGITVGLTSIPQGIAYAMVAGLPPQVGLYSSIFPGLVYMLFGSCKDVTVGPTAILAALLAKYVAKSADFAYLASFLSGCFILLLGVLQLGFLLDFISKPVISGFTTAAAMQISASQLKPLFRIKGSSGNTFITAVINFFTNIRTVQLWDTVLGLCSIAALLLLKCQIGMYAILFQNGTFIVGTHILIPGRNSCIHKAQQRATVPVTPTTSPGTARFANTWLYVVRARNALVVFAAAILALALKLHDMTPFALTGTIQGGLPEFGAPPFHTVVDNKTLEFDDMLSVFGVEGFVMPLVAILESIAIAKAFAGSAPVDGTQEMLAIGACNVAASFCQAMPATGSFTRTAINHASGVLTPAGCFFKATLVLLAVTFLADAFYYIPRATLAAIIVVAMFSLMELRIIRTLWRNSRLELVVLLLTLVTGACAGLEYGIVCGAVADAARALAGAARPALPPTAFKVGNQDCVSVTLTGALSYSSSQHVQERVRRHVSAEGALVVLDGRLLNAIDLGVAENLIAVILDLEKNGYKFLLWNFKESHKKLFEDLNSSFESRFVDGTSIDQHILCLELTR